MFHVIFSLTSRFLYLRTVLQGFARGILALRSLGAISSHLTPALSPPPPLPLLDAPVPFAEHPEQTILPYPSRDVIAIQRQFPVFASPFPIYQSSLIAVTPNHVPKFLPILVAFAVISGFVVILPEIAYFFTKIAPAFTHASSYITKPFKFKPMFYCQPTSLPSQVASLKLPIAFISLLLLWTGPPAIATFFTFVWFMSILFSYEQASNMIVSILQWCGLLIVQDTRTPPLLDAIYEQITRGTAEYNDLVRCGDLSDKHNKYQVITDYSVSYSHLATQLSDGELGLQCAPMPREDQELEVSVQRILTESVGSQNLHRQLELSRAREQKLDADLLASEHEHERLIELISTLENSRRNQEGWKEIAAVAKSLYVEGETIIINLRADLTTATARVRNLEEQLDHQIELASGKDNIIQSITKESRLAHIRLRIAKYKIERADVELQDERDRRIRERRGLLNEKVMVQGRYESEIRRLTQEAQDAQEQLDTLRNTLSQLRSDGQSPLDRDHPFCHQPATTWPYDTGQPTLPPEWKLNTGIPPVSPAIDSDSSHRSTKLSPHSPIQDLMDPSTRLASLLLEIPGFCDQESEVAKKLWAALAELIEWVRQVEPESAEDVKPNERDETRLRGELNATKEQLCLAEEDARDLRHELGQSRVSLRKMETQVRALECELDICRATVREAQDAQHVTEAKFSEATQLVRVHQAESESSMARAEESQLKCSQVTFLCAALRERVTELEAKVKKLKSSRKYQANSNSRSRSLTGTCRDLEVVAHDPGIQDFDSIYMTVPPSMPRLLDLPLPPPSSPSNDSSLYLDHQEFSTIPLAAVDSDPKANKHDADAQSFDSSFMTSPPCLPCPLDLPSPPSLSKSSTSSFCFSRQMRPVILQGCTDSHSSSPEDIGVTMPDADSQILDLSLSPQASTNLSHLLSPSQSEDFSLPPFILPRTFTSERNSLGSVDWPPIGSSLLPEHENALQDDNISLGSPAEGNENDSIFLCRKAVLSPIKELDELEVLERHTSLDRDRPVVPDDDRKSWGSSQRNHTSDPPPIWTLSSPQFRAFPTGKRRKRRQVDIPVTPGRKEVTRSSLVSLDHVPEPPRIVVPAFARITLPRFSLSPSGIDKVLERRLALSEPGNDQSNTEVGRAAPDPLLDGLLSSTRNGELHSTEALPFPHANRVPCGETLSMLPTERQLSRRSQDACRTEPPHNERLDPFSTAGPVGVMSSLASPDTFLPQVRPPSISSAQDCQDNQRSSPSVLLLDPQLSQTMQLGSLCGCPTAVLRSRQKGINIDSETGTSPSRTTLGSLRSRLHTSVDQGTSMKARRRRRRHRRKNPVLKSTNITGARTDLAFLSSSDDFSINTSRSSVLPLSHVSNLPDVSFARKDAKMLAVKRLPRSMPRPPPSCLVSELLDQSFIQSDEASLGEDDPPCASGNARKGNHPDCFLSRNTVSSFGCAVIDEDFVFFIPSDCPTSTPVASRKRASSKYSADSGAAALAGVNPF